jgi:NAD+ diphosphatase
MPRDFIPSLTTTNDTARSDAWWFVFSGYRLLVSLSGEKVEIPASTRLKSCGLEITRQIFLGSYRGHPCYAAEGMLRNNEQTHTVFRELRSLFEIPVQNPYLVD